jgi:hypothetical protein
MSPPGRADAITCSAVSSPERQGDGGAPFVIRSRHGSAPGKATVPAASWSAHLAATKPPTAVPASGVAGSRRRHGWRVKAEPSST